MSSPLAALVKSYEQRRSWTLEMPRLGLPGVERHTFDAWGSLPSEEIGEFSAKTKDPTVLCVERLADGQLSLVPVAAGVSSAGFTLVRQLVRRGVHPLDIVVASYSIDKDEWTFRTAVDHLFWTFADQQRLEEEEVASP